MSTQNQTFHLGLLLYYYRKKHKITQKQIATMFNVSQSTVHCWEKGIHPNGPKTIEIIKLLKKQKFLPISLPSPPEEIAQKNSTAE